MKRRRIQIDYQVSARRGTLFDWPIVPNILTDGDTQSNTIYLDDTRFGTGAEITFLIEYAVVG